MAHGVGAAFKLRTRLLLGFGLVFAMMIGIAVTTYRGTTSQMAASDYVRHTHEVIAHGHLLEKELVDMETGQRGFLITGVDTFLEPLESGRDAYETTLEETKILVSDNPPQVKRLEEIDILVTRWKERSVDPEILERRKVAKGAVDAAHLQEVLSGGVGKGILDEMRGIMDEMQLAFQVDGNVKGEALTAAVAKAMVDQETGERGFLIAGEDEFLEPFIDGQEKLKLSIADLRRLVANAHDRFGTVTAINDIEKLAERWLTEAGGVEIEMRRNVDAGTATRTDLEKVLGQGLGKSILDSIREEIDALDTMFTVAENDKGRVYLVRIAKAMVDQETGQRGFIITGKEEFLEPYETGQQALAENLQGLRELNSNAYDIPRMKRNIDTLETMAGNWMVRAATPEIDARRAMNENETSIKDVQAMVESERGKDMMDGIRVKIAEFIAIEEGLLASRRVDSEQAGTSSINIVFFGTVFGVLAGILALIYISRSIFVQVGGEPSEISGVADRIARGDLDVDFHSDSGIGESVSTILDTLREVSRQADLIAGGDYSEDIKARDANDSLGIALQKMTETLRDVSGAIDSIADGDLEIHVEQKGINDMLSQSLTRMTANLRETAAQANVIAGGNYMVDFRPRSDKDELAIAMQLMTSTLRDNENAARDEDWVKTGAAELAEVLQREEDERTLAQSVVSYLANYLKAQMASFYLFDRATKTLKIAGSFAFNKRKNLNDEVILGEGIAGQAAFEREMISITMLPDDYVRINSTLGDAVPGNVVAVPVVDDDELLGVIEFATVDEFTDLELSFLTAAMGSIATAVKISKDQDNLRRSEELTRTIIETSKDAILTINSIGVIQTINGTTRKMFVYSEDELLGHNIHEIIPSPFSGELGGHFEKGQESWYKQISGTEREVQAMRMGGVPFPAVLSVGEVETDDGILFTIYVRDISAQKKAEEEIQRQTEELHSSNEELSQQSEELKASNDELEVKSQALEEQTDELKTRATEIEAAKSEVEKKAEELELASKYKSEFLANMSHELRTPLNSLLILAKMLASNDEGNLTDDQVESAKVIHGGGQDLLFLINEILDLSKVEAGMMEIHNEEVRLDDMIANMRRQFDPATKEKGLGFDIVVEPGIDDSIVTDGQRLEQILRNFMSNALKFTSEGGLTIEIGRPNSGREFSYAHLTPTNTLAIGVRDTGVGIPEEKQRAIFEAFQQADGSTSRQYGGTGLGLSISRAMAHLLGGEVQLESEDGVGSVFTLFLPLERRVDRANSDVEVAQEIEHPQRRAVRPETSKPSPPTEEFLPDDRKSIKENDRSVLIIEDDETFAKIVMGQANKKGFKCLAASDGRTGLALASEFKPDGIILDLGLPDLDGTHVLDGLKQDLGTRHIPVHIMSGRDKTAEVMQKGAVAYLSKPVSADDINSALENITRLRDDSVRNILVVEDDDNGRAAIEKLVSTTDVQTVGATSGGEARELVMQQNFDCIILDLGLPDMTGFELLESLDRDPSLSLPPVIVYTGKELSSEELRELGKYTTKVVVKSANSPERLLDETSLFLHTIASALPEDQEEILRAVHNAEESLEGKKVLLVDDDLRNSFALSKVLDNEGLEVVLAENGQVALDMLEKNQDVDMVLMDIMMPVMDGFEAMTKIREQAQYKDLPIVALTAKAMVEDRAKCIEAGANDYQAKPIDTDRLLSLMRVLMYS